jgi:hypothetical protein
MSTRDPNLQKLFAQADQDFRDDSFAADVLRQIDRERRRMLLVWFALIVLTLICFVFLASPVLAAFSMATRALPIPLLEIETEWLRLLLSPINSVAAAIAVAALGLRKFFRRIFQ